MEEEEQWRKRGTKTGNKTLWTSKRKKKKKHNSQQINEDTEQLDIWYIQYVCVCVSDLLFYKGLTEGKKPQTL